MRLAILAVSLVMIIGFSAAAESGNYSSDIFKVEGVCMDGNASGVSEVNHSRGENDSRIVEFMGGIESSTPCQEINYSVEQEDDRRYVLDVTTEPANAENRTACVQCTGEVRYHAYFRALQPFELEVRHEGQTVETLNHPHDDSDDNIEINTSSQNQSDASDDDSPDDSSSDTSGNGSQDDRDTEENDSLADGNTGNSGTGVQNGSTEDQETNSQEDGVIRGMLRGFIDWFRGLF